MAQYQKLFKNSYIDKLITDLKTGENLNLYGKTSFDFDNENVTENKRIVVSDLPEFNVPENGQFYEYENAVKLFKYLPDLNRTQATDKRIWTFLAHGPYWLYLKARWPLPEATSGKKKIISHILDHWFLEGSKSLSRHGIASLWWGAFITYDDKKKNPFELTKEFFSKMDYKKVILEENICFYTPLVHAILEYIIENKDLFENQWAPKVRFLIRKLNFVSGYKILSSLPKSTIKIIIDDYRKDIEAVKKIK